MRQLLILLFITSFFSCIVDSTSYEISLGNYFYDRGDNFEAQLHYLKAIKTESQNVDLAYFNLGNTYVRMGEYSEALKIWDNIYETKNKELRFKIRYNRGILFFKNGEYMKSYNNFKEAIALNPTHINAKKLLEEMSHRIEKPNNDRVNSEIDITKEEVERLFSVVRQKEEKIWNQSQRDDSSSSDW